MQCIIAVVKWVYTTSFWCLYAMMERSHMVFSPPKPEPFKALLYIMAVRPNGTIGLVPEKKFYI